MPLLSEFAGIKIYIYWNDHMPPHFHAEYNDAKILVDINSAAVLKGVFPANKLKLILAWTELHRDDLIDRWNKARDNQMPEKIKPLE